MTKKTTVAKERKFDGVWDAKRILRYYLYFANEDGFLMNMNSWEESTFKIRQRRFLAAMKAYGREESIFYYPEEPFLDAGCTGRYVISKKRSKNKMNKIRNLIRQNLTPNAHYDKMLSSKNFFSNEKDVWLAFEKLFELRKGLLTLEHKCSEVLECRPSVGMINRATDSLYRNNVRAVNEVIDEMLVLLMGDDYDKTFTEKELLQFGYPDVTDEELYEMELVIRDRFHIAELC